MQNTGDEIVTSLVGHMDVDSIPSTLKVGEDVANYTDFWFLPFCCVLHNKMSVY